jgi:hypothetical protein
MTIRKPFSRRWDSDEGFPLANILAALFEYAIWQTFIIVMGVLTSKNTLGDT